MDICPKVHNAHDTTHRHHGAYKEGSPGHGSFSPALRGDQDDHGRWREMRPRRERKVGGNKGQFQILVRIGGRYRRSGNRTKICSRDDEDLGIAT